MDKINVKVTPNEVKASAQVTTPMGSGSAPIAVDTALSPTSTNPVQNKAIYEALKNVKPSTDIDIDTALSTTSENPVQNKAITSAVNGLTTRVSAVESTVGGLASGSPIPVATVAQMVDTTKVYLYTGTESGYTAGDWYYYDGTEWVSGGTYGTGTISTNARNLLQYVLERVAYTETGMQTYVDALIEALKVNSGGGEVTGAYSVTYALTNVTTDGVSAVDEGEPFSCNLTAVTDYMIDTVSVTMGGTDITASAYSGGVVTIAAVTGDVMIVANGIYVGVWYDGLYTPENVITGSYITDTGEITQATTYSGYYEDYIPVGNTVGMHVVYSSNDNGSLRNFRISTYDANKTFIEQHHLQNTNKDDLIFNGDVAFIRLGWYSENGGCKFSLYSARALPMEIGTINSTTGEDEASTARIRSGYIDAEGTISVEGFAYGSVGSLGGYAFRCYNSATAFIGSLTNNGALFRAGITNKALPTDTKSVRMFLNHPNGAGYTFKTGWGSGVTNLMKINGIWYRLTESE